MKLLLENWRKHLHEDEGKVRDKYGSVVSNKAKRSSEKGKKALGLTEEASEDSI